VTPNRRIVGAAIALAAATACDGDSEPAALQLAAGGGGGQVDTVTRTLATPYAVAVTDAGGAPAGGVTITWTVVSGGGTMGAVSPTNGAGIATAVHTLGTVAGPQVVRAAVTDAAGSPVTFTSTALAAAPATLVKSAGDAQSGVTGQPLSIPLSVLARDAHGNPTPDRAVDWLRVAGSGTLAASQTLTDPAGVTRVGYTLGPTAGVEAITATLAVGSVPAVRFTATAAGQLLLVAQVPIPANYGIHDTFVRDGLAFVNAWDTGVMIFDVGNGIGSGNPSSPQWVSTIATVGGNAHNSWWFHNPNTSEKKYLFVGQEGSGTIGSSSSGDIHVVDVTNLMNPVEVATYRLAGAGTHNFWMDEQAAILYAAYYNGGVVALDVSGTLTGDLAGRELDRLQPGAGNTYTWGVQLYNGSLYASDMLSGFWQLTATAPLGVVGGGNNVPERYGSDLWVHGSYAYTGTWGTRSAPGNAVKIWRLGAGGAPTLVDSIVQTGVGTVSDVEVSPDGKLLMFSAENGSQAGLHLYALTNPARPTFVARALVSTGLHTATFGTIGGRLYAFAARNPLDPALLIFDVTDYAPLAVSR